MQCHTHTRILHSFTHSWQSGDTFFLTLFLNLHNLSLFVLRYKECSVFYFSCFSILSYWMLSNMERRRVVNMLIRWLIVWCSDIPAAAESAPQLSVHSTIDIRFVRLYINNWTSQDNQILSQQPKQPNQPKEEGDLFVIYTVQKQTHKFMENIFYSSFVLFFFLLNTI